MSEDTEIFYKQIKNKIAKLDRRNLVKRLILTIRTIERIDSIPDRKFHLWNLYFLLKMAVKFGIFAPSKLINDNDLIHLHNLCTRLNNFVPPEIEQQGHATSTKIVRIISYQQFWLQKRLNFQDIGRTIKLVELSEFDPVTSFNTVLNISTKEFIKYTFILFAWINSHQDFETIDLNDISFVTKDKEAFESVINYLTRDVSDLAKELNENRPIRSTRLEIFEQSTLFRYPICKIDNSFYLISVRLLEKSITQLIVEKLSTISSISKTKKSLSVGFEKYVEMYFLDTGDTYINELQIRNNYNLGEGDKVTDFYVSNSFGNVYIECKAIFAHPLTKVLPTSDILIKSYNDSIIKAVVQGLSTHAYRKSLHSEENYILIVTLDELYFGSFNDVYSEFIKEGLKKHFPDFEEYVNAFGLNNIFIISISDYEHLLSYSKAIKINLVSLMKKLTDFLNSKEHKIYANFMNFFKEFIRTEHGGSIYNYSILLERITAKLLNEVIEEVRQTTEFNKDTPNIV